MDNGRITCASEIVGAIMNDVTSGIPPVTYPFANAGQMAEYPFHPGEIAIIAGAPGSGKTAFCMQAVLECLRFTPTIRGLVCNVEISVSALIMRLFSYLSGVALTDIMRHQIKSEEMGAFEQGAATFRSVADRLAFLNPPFTLENVAAALGLFSPHILLLDYIQRFELGGDASFQSPRQRVNANMDLLRDFASADLSVVVVSALSRVPSQTE